jgi:autotransporter adhesin
MNKIFSLVWSRSLQMLVVASEFAATHGGKAGRVRRAGTAAAGAVVLSSTLILAPFAQAATSDDVSCTLTLPGKPATQVDCDALEKAVAAASVSSRDELQQPAATENVFDAGYFKANGNGDGSDDAMAVDEYATAVGSASFALGVGTTALGSGATAINDFSVAVGYGSSATADNSVALGGSSLADRANTVSVGSVDNERQITNVAAGIEATDAVNVAQLDASTQYIAFGPHEGPGGGINGDFEPASATGIGAVAVGMNSNASGAFAAAYA